MKKISVKTKGVALLAIGAILFSVSIVGLNHGMKVSKQAAGARQQAQRIRVANFRAIMMADKLEKKLKGQPIVDALPMSDAVPEAVQSINRTASAYGVVISNIQVQSNNAFGSQYNTLGIPVASLGTNTPLFRGVLHQAVMIKGQWKTLSGLTNWLNAIESTHAAISKITIKNHLVTADVEVFGA